VTGYNADNSNPITVLSGQDCSSINNSKPLKGSRGSKENKGSKEISIKRFVGDYLIDTPSGFKFKFKLKICKSVHHHTIQINQPNRCKNFSSLLLVD
jgi:hypothetical protein